jgi:carbonic anhydrase
MISQIYSEVISVNNACASNFSEKAALALPPARRFAILTCMDARLDPARYAGLAEGDARVIRNAGGRASDDAIRSLVISHKLLGTQEWFVIHHSDCCMQLFTGEIIGNLLEDDLETALPRIQKQGASSRTCERPSDRRSPATYTRPSHPRVSRTIRS